MKTLGFCLLVLLLLRSTQWGTRCVSRAVAVRAGVPIVPGSDGPLTQENARAFGAEHGFPFALKAVAGGGGRGFQGGLGSGRVEEAWSQASGEGQRYFGNPAVYAEKYLEHPRHIEIQIFADNMATTSDSANVTVRSSDVTRS